MAIKIYSEEYVQTLEDVFEVKSHFLPTFGGGLQIKDGVKNSENFMVVKVSDTDVVVQDYSTDPNVAFEDGTSNTNRFGKRKEIKSVDKQIPYEKPLAIHEGVDDFTVNDMPDQVIAERQLLHAEAWTDQMNMFMSKALSENAGKTLTAELTEEGISKLFADAHKEMVNNKVSKSITWRAYVNADVYNFIVDHKLATTAKHSSSDIDNQTVLKFKGFVLEELADAYFQEGEVAYFAPDNVAVAGVGIQVYRVMDSEDFAGVVIQSASKWAKYVPEKNKKAILKATGGATTEAPTDEPLPEAPLPEAPLPEAPLPEA